MKKIILMLSCLMLCRDLCLAEKTEPNSPTRILQTNWTKIINILTDKQLDPNVKEAKIEKLAVPLFDLELMAKLSLGRKHWPKLSKEQQKKFTKLFKNKLASSYLDKVNLYEDEEPVYRDPVKKKNAVHIPMELVSDQRKIEMLYKFYKAKTGWLIYDVEVEGVSILQTYRSQFNDILSNGTVEDLIASLTKPSSG